jgi:HAD superfamily hydrolase (TIGR01509 family)
MTENVTIDAVLLDIDGTLIDSNPLHMLAWQRAFRRLGRHEEGNRVLHLMGMGGDKLAPEVLGDAPPELIERAKDLWIEEYSRKGLVEHAEPLPGAVELLQELRRRGVKVALASSGEQADIDRYLSLLGGRESFDELVSSNDVEATKPEPDIFALALEKLGNPARAVVIGDTVWDIEAASAIQLPCVGVLTGGIERSALEEAGAAGVYADAADVLAHLDDVLSLETAD